MKEDNPHSPITPADLPRSFAASAATELPKIRAFEDLLIQTTEQLRMGTIDERMFLQVLTENKEPVKVLARSKGVKNRQEEIIEVERTEEGEIHVRTQHTRRRPQITINVGLSKGGHLTAKDIATVWVNPDVINPEVRENTPPIDLLSHKVSRLDISRALIRHLRNVVPFENRLQTKQPRSTI